MNSVTLKLAVRDGWRTALATVVVCAVSLPATAHDASLQPTSDHYQLAQFGGGGGGGGGFGGGGGGFGGGGGSFGGDGGGDGGFTGDGGSSILGDVIGSDAVGTSEAELDVGGQLIVLRGYDNDLTPDRPYIFDHNLTLPGVTDVLPSNVMFPDLGPMPQVPLTPGTPSLPDVQPPAEPPLDPGDYTGHCAAAICAGTGAGPIRSPGIAATGNTRVAGVDAASGEGGKKESGGGQGGSFASTLNRLSFPTTVALQYSDRKPKCSGVLVSDDQVLTAAHCLCGDFPLYAFFGETLFTSRVRGRGLRTSLPLQSKAEFFDSNFCTAWTDGRAFDEGMADIALLTLNQELPETLAKAILPVDPIARTNTLYQKLYAVGFGESDNRFRPGDKNFVELDFLLRICRNSEICIQELESTAARPPADTCFGDSGGPLFIQNGTGAQMQLAGITSRALNSVPEGSPAQCGGGGIYVSLEAPKIRAWLDARLDK